MNAPYDLKEFQNQLELDYSREKLERAIAELKKLNPPIKKRFSVIKELRRCGEVRSRPK